MAEILDIYDENKKITGRTIERRFGDKLKDKDYFLYVQAWIVDSKKEILLTQRKFDKTHGGMWEPTGGCVKSGETSIQGIRRELKEEVGLDIEEKDLELIKVIKEKAKNRNCFKDIYIVKKEIKLNEIKFLDGEVINCKYATVEEFEKMINDKEIQEWLRFFIDVIK